MTADRLVLIYNPRLRRPGSGYLIRPTIVLTARHVVEIEQAELELLTREQARRGEPWMQAVCVWVSKDHDLALLELVRPVERRPQLVSLSPRLIALPRDEPVTDLRIDGFPEFMAQNSCREALFARGVTHDPAQSGDKLLYLEVTSFGPDDGLRQQALLDNSSAWGGMSGSAVLYKGCVVGVVVVDSSSGKSTSVLRLVPIRLVLDDPTFREKVSLDARLSHHQCYRREVISKLVGYETLLSLLERTLAMAAGDGWSGAQRAEAVVDAIVAAQSLDPINRAFFNLEGVPAASSRELRKALVDLALSMLGLLTDEQSVAEIVNCREDISLPVLDAPCGLAMAAETMMAAVDRRPPVFGGLKDELDYPSGQYRLELPPESGMAADQGAITADLTARFQPNGAISSAVNRSVLSRFERSGLRYPDEASQLAAAKRFFAAASRRKTYYLAESLDESLAEDVIASLRQVKRDFPALVTLRLTTQYVGDDIDRLVPLQEMLADLAKEDG